MKKLLSMTLCVLLFAFAGLPSVSVSATTNEDNIYRDGNYIFEVVNDCEITIHHYIGTDDTVIVPATIGGLPVKSIEKWAFFGTDVKEVSVSEGITTMGEEVFYNCQSLETAVLPSTLEKTDKALFRFCQNLKDVTFSGTETDPMLGKYLLYACNSLESVNIPSKVTKIPEGMFAYCQSLDNVILPEGTQKIYDNAFYGSGLSNITLPEPIYYIGDMAFADCATLDEINNLRESCDIVSENAFKGSSTANPYEETEKTTIYFVNTLNWTDITVSYYAIGYSETYGWCEIDMTFVETNYFGQDVYKADIPASINIYFNGKVAEHSYASTTFTKISGENNGFFPNGGLEIGTYKYSPDINPLATDAVTIYFVNTLNWTDITITYSGKDIKIPFWETNAFGQEVYTTKVPASAIFYFSGIVDDKTMASTEFTQISSEDDGFFPNAGLEIGTYKYSSDINPLDPDAPVPTSTEDEATTLSKTNVQPVGASSPDEFSGYITDEGLLIGAAFPEVVEREKGIAAEVGAQVDTMVAANMDSANNVRDRGDCNLNGRIDIRDATLIQKYKADMIKINDPQFEYKNADADANGTVNVKDATYIQKHIAEIVTIHTGPVQSA